MNDVEIYVRRVHGGHDTGVYQDAIENLAEELGDVIDCVLVLEKSFGGLSALSGAIGEKKMKRWCKRLEERQQ